MEVLLDDDVAAAGEAGVLVADHDRGPRRRALRVLRAVDEPEQVALVEELEPVHLVDHLRVPVEPDHQPPGELEAQVEAMGADVEEQVAGCRDGGVPGAGELGERMQAGRARPAEEAVPELGADADHARQRGLGDAEADRSPQPADVRQHVADLVLGAGVHGEDEEDRRLGERRQNGLGLDCRHRVSLYALQRQAYPLVAAGPGR